ncbi:MAG TPA: methylmalonyl Co-A mutase-associated GTPase MeaB [Bdellovibrionales bacterium]|nr:methylmalonyl Co-A mutase-associated GTPase MeaB [Bdellovibrionales bacterium]
MLSFSTIPTGMSDQSGMLLKSLKAGDLRAFARFLSLLEREGPAALGRYPDLMKPEKPCFRFGITGPPGAGKSTLVGQLIARFRAQNLKVGVLAVDPSSPFTKGAILGDRIRYTEHFVDPGVFIRSVGTRGSVGGLSASSFLMVRAFDLAGFDIVLLETVGVGQTELEIMHVADCVSVTLVPESGDSIQGMKAGLLEIADLFIVNKSDRPGADAFVRELEAALHLDPHAEVKPIVKTAAVNGMGLDELASKILALRSSDDWKNARAGVDRLRSEAQSLLRMQAEREIEERVQSVKSTGDFTNLFKD